jgi:DNA-binding IclR family transcriptional regulator
MTEGDEADGDYESGPRVKAVDTTFAIVKSLRTLDGGKVTEIVEETGLSKGAVYKHLSTLQEHDFVVKDGSEYALGFRFLDYGGWLRSNYTGSGIIKPQIQELAEETNEVAMFAIQENARIVTLFRENGNQGVFTRTRLGRRMYPSQTAGGKAILSQLPDEEVRSILDTTGLPKETENTITDEAKLFEELETVRERGYAFNREESTKGLVAVAVPLVPGDTVLGACSVAGPRHRMGDERLNEEIVDMLLSVVNELELNITHSQKSTDMFGST